MASRRRPNAGVGADSGGRAAWQKWHRMLIGVYLMSDFLIVNLIFPDSEFGDDFHLTYF